MIPSSPSNVIPRTVQQLPAGDAQHSPGEPAEARQYIADEYGWDITDGGIAE